jgi:hypothetical protein
MDIFDRKTGLWYKVERGFFGKLHLTEIKYLHIIRCPTNSDLEFVDSDNELHQVNIPEPKPCSYCGDYGKHEHSGVRKLSVANEKKVE